jgi:hypothetical protein
MFAEYTAHIPDHLIVIFIIARAVVSVLPLWPAGAHPQGRSEFAPGPILLAECSRNEAAAAEAIGAGRP